MKRNITKFISEHILVGDKIVWTILGLLLSISLVEVYSATSTLTFTHGRFWAPGITHVMMIAAGVVACSIVSHFSMNIIKVAALIGNVFSVILLLCALFFGEKVNGATRWVFGLQPSEIAKGVLVMTVALILSFKYDGKTDNVSDRAFWWAAGLTCFYCMLIATENLSTAGLLFIVIVMIMFVGRVRLRTLLVTAGPVFLVAGLGFWFMKTCSSETAKAISEITVFDKLPLHRFPTWVNRLKGDDKVYTADKYPINNNLQVAHAKIAVATSSLIGCGPGNSVQRDYLPQAYSDFIFAIIIEELGLIGGIFVMLLYVALLFQVGNHSRQCKERFPQILSMGLTLLIVTQAMFNIFVAVGILPVTGQQLPLVSRGGTGIILNCIYMGMILAMTRVAHQSDEPVVAPVSASPLPSDQPEGEDEAENEDEK